MSIFNRMVDAVLSSRANALRASVANHGGVCTFPFSQCQAPVSTWLSSSASLNPEVNGGICSALSSHWIYHHSQDSSLWKWLYTNGNVPNAGKLNQLMMAQAYSLTATQGQEEFEDGWLSGNAITRRQRQGFRRTEPLPQFDIPSRLEGEHLKRPAEEGRVGLRRPTNLAQAIVYGIGAKTATGKLTGNYVRISVSSLLGAHCMSAWVADDVCFFDPNFGEFYFDSRMFFSWWFSNVFWPKSSYAAILSGDWSVSEYSPKHVPGMR